ncbi:MULTISPECIES: acyl carrier protein [unclassified Streptomyces]|uniref:Acyl carrier protein n=1 Tax=Streptomyces sp. NBC_00060 TaxID=2975636 RepID=A0AAU2HAG0_9ACTN
MDTIDPTDSLAVVAAAIAGEVEIATAELDLDCPIRSIPGLESVKLLRAIAEIERVRSVAIPDDFLFEAETARELAGLIEGLPKESS